MRNFTKISSFRASKRTLWTGKKEGVAYSSISGFARMQKNYKKGTHKNSKTQLALNSGVS